MQGDVQIYNDRVGIEELQIKLLIAFCPCSFAFTLDIAKDHGSRQSLVLVLFMCCPILTSLSLTEILFIQ